MKRIFISSVILLALVSGSATGRPLQSLFDLGSGVRAAGLGEAFTGLADDEYALFYNPAALSKLSRLRVSAFFESHFTASTYLAATGATKSLGLGFLVFDLGNMPMTDSNNSETGTFGYTSFGFLAGYGLGLPADLSIGVRLKFFNYGTSDASKKSVSGGAIAIDPAVMWAPDSLTLGPVSNLRIGLLLELPGVAWAAKDENFPFGVRIGFSFRAIKDLAVVSDFSLADGFHLGVEYAIANLAPPIEKLCVRLGLMTRGGFQLTLGLGVIVSGIQVDYAFISHEASASHRLSASYTLNFKLF
jgi:hypothetical protein